MPRHLFKFDIEDEESESDEDDLVDTEEEDEDEEDEITRYRILSLKCEGLKVYAKKSKKNVINLVIFSICKF